MPFCPKCKVSLAPDASVCPLCLTPVAEKPEAKKSETPSDTDRHPAVSFAAVESSSGTEDIISPEDKRKIYVELLSVSFGIVLAVTLVMDLVFFKGFSWSRYTSLVIVLLWLCLVVPLLNWGKILRICLILSPALILGLFLWALMGGDLSWFAVPGLTIAIASETAVVVSVVIIGRLKRRGLNVVGIILAAAGLLCAGIDASVASYLHHRLFLSWSAIILMAVLPVAIFFYYLHYRIMNQASLRKLFRL